MGMELGWIYPLEHSIFLRNIGSIHGTTPSFPNPCQSGGVYYNAKNIGDMLVPGRSQARMAGALGIPGQNRDLSERRLEEC